MTKGVSERLEELSGPKKAACRGRRIFIKSRCSSFRGRAENVRQTEAGFRDGDGDSSSGARRGIGACRPA